MPSEQTVPPASAGPGPVDRRGRIAVVPARFGPTIIGGAEIVLRRIASGLQDRGWDVEVLTTCAVDYFSWDNEVPAGLAVEDGLPVRRFPVVASTSGAERDALGHRMLAGDRLTPAEQMRWINADVRVPELFSYLLERSDDYRALLFGPYLFWPAFACSQVAPERSLLWTCLHDEPYAYQPVFEPLLSGLAGLFLQTDPEHELAHRIHATLAPHEVVGCGVEVPTTYDPEGFRARHGIDRPFLLYAGRREGAKGWDELLAAFARAVTRRGLPFSLVTMGAGPVVAPPGLEDRVVDLGFLPDDERDNAYAAAAAYVQPSRYEAFSRTIMESWLAGTPVIGVGEGGVVRHHIERSQAGIVYDDEHELEEALAFVADRPELAARLGARGRTYVLDRYQWGDVLDRIESRIEAWVPYAGDPAPGGPPTADPAPRAGEQG